MSMTPEEKKAYTGYKFGKAEETLRAAKILSKEEIWTSVVNRLYYASFYAVSALLVESSNTKKTHKSLKSEFNKDYIRTKIISKASGVVFNALFIQRNKGDYDSFVEFTREDIVPMIDKVENLLSEVKVIIDKKY